MSNSFNSIASRLLWTTGIVGVLLTGCRDSSQSDVHRIQTQSMAAKENRDSLREVFRYLPQLIRLDRTAAMKDINYQLNTWSASVANPPAWKKSELFDGLPSAILTSPLMERVSKLEFSEPECEFMLQCDMLKQVGRWVLDRPYRDQLYAGWLESQKASLDPNDHSKLETTLKLFDWAMCNVALDGAPSDAEKLITNPNLPLDDRASVYRQLPWQTMMFSRGDVWERARLFTQLCFAQGIDAVVLALPSQTGAIENSALRLWCVGVPIADELYLFEPRWGLPFPMASGPGIATLRQMKSDPNILRRAKLPGRFEYPVEAKDLKTLFALMDTEPFALGRAMYTLERSLTGELRHRLSVDGDAFAQRLTKIDPELSVRLWTAPWLAHLYNLAVRTRLDDLSPFSLAYMEQNGVFITDTPISLARTLHFKGQFESTIDAAGALRTYMDFRVDEETLKDLEYDRETQRALGVMKRATEPMENFQFRVKQAQAFYRRSKFDIGIFLAMANIDLGKPETAIDWLTKRTLEVKGTERWHSHAHYLLGRNKETIKDYAGAIEEYKYENSAQAAGNRIRIRKLEAILNPSTTPEVNQ